MAGVLRNNSHAVRIGIGFEIWVSARRMLTVHLSKTHPDWDRGRIHREVARGLSRGAL